MLNSSSTRPTARNAYGRLDLPDSRSAQVAVSKMARVLPPPMALP